MEVIWSKRAVQNLKLIYDFYKKHSLSAADNMVRGIKRKGDALKPNILHQTEENLTPNQFRTVYRHYKIVYPVKRDRVMILQIFDARQNPSKFK